jgi:trimeric autotransporter adhesin
MRNSFWMALLILTHNTVAWAAALGTEFRYTGFLTDNGNPANGNYDFQAILYDNDPGGNQVGQIQSPQNVSAVNGVFQFSIDFGSVFDGKKIWLELRVKPSNGNNWTTMSPRQLLTGTPYALFAPTAGSVSANGVTGLMIQNSTITKDKIGSGEVVKSLNSLRDDVNLLAGPGINFTTNIQNSTLEISVMGLAANFWSLTGNSGTTPNLNFLGTLDNQPLELRVDSARAMRLEPAYLQLPPPFAGSDSSINVIGGHLANAVGSGVIGGTIAGGGYLHSSGTIGGFSPFPNLVVGNFGTVGGGYTNRADYAATVGGGHHNSASREGFIGGGARNWMDPDYSRNSVIAGGFANEVYRTGGVDDFLVFSNATIGGGWRNIVGGNFATVPGGYFNRAYGVASFAAGYSASALHEGCFVWNDSACCGLASTGPNQFAIKATGGVRLRSETDIYFDNPLRQKIYLSGESEPHGIGVQKSTTYFRTGGQFSGNVTPEYPLGYPGDGFAWYAGGSHLDTPYDPGGGYDLMELRYDAAGNRNPATGNYSPGAYLAVWGSIYCDAVCTAVWFNSLSDRDQKTAIEEVNNEDLLDRVLALPITKWTFKKAPDVRHIGPMAQDFHAAFGIGTDDRHIGLADASGVALAAIQGLNQKVEKLVRAQGADITSLQQRNTALEQRVTELERLVAMLVAGGRAPNP